jgi:hypothetical protein
MLQQLRFDFPQLDAEAADFDLVVDAAQKLDGAVGSVAGKVAGFVQTAAADLEGVGYETFCG